MTHGNTKQRWLFAHDGSDGNGLPISPCDHKHGTYEEAIKCAKSKGLKFIRRVTDAKGVRDYEV